MPSTAAIIALHTTELAEERDLIVEHEPLPTDRRRSRVLPFPERAPVSEPRNRFTAALERISCRSGYRDRRNSDAPLGYYGGRPIISELSRVNGGIYLGGVSQEALVIDDRYQKLEQMWALLEARLTAHAAHKPLTERAVLLEVFQLVQRVLPIDPDGYRRVVTREQIQGDQKLALDLFLQERVGLARHQVLLAAYLLQRLDREQRIEGVTSLDPYSHHARFQDERLTYTSRTGEVFTFNPAKRYCATGARSTGGM